MLHQEGILKKERSKLEPGAKTGGIWDLIRPSANRRLCLRSITSRLILSGALRLRFSAYCNRGQWKTATRNNIVCGTCCFHDLFYPSLLICQLADFQEEEIESSLGEAADPTCFFSQPGKFWWCLAGFGYKSRTLNGYKSRTLKYKHLLLARLAKWALMAPNEFSRCSSQVTSVPGCISISLPLSSATE